MAVAVEHEIELRILSAGGEVGCQVHSRRATPPGPSEALSRDQIAVSRPLTGQRAVAIGIGKKHPTIRSAGNDQRERISVTTIAVQVGGGQRPQRELRDSAAVVGTAGAHGGHPAESLQAVSSNRYGIAGRGDGAKRYRPFVGK